jgi:hypothetical protein
MKEIKKTILRCVNEDFCHSTVPISDPETNPDPLRQKFSDPDPQHWIPGAKYKLDLIDSTDFNTTS